jgi:hypothetical protein
MTAILNIRVLIHLDQRTWDDWWARELLAVLVACDNPLDLLQSSG